MAVQQLSEEQNDQLMKGFDEVELQKIGPGKHEAFEKLLEELERTYSRAA